MLVSLLLPLSCFLFSLFQLMSHTIVVLFLSLIYGPSIRKLLPTYWFASTCQIDVLSSANWIWIASSVLRSVLQTICFPLPWWIDNSLSSGPFFRLLFSGIIVLGAKMKKWKYFLQDGYPNAIFYKSYLERYFYNFNEINWRLISKGRVRDVLIRWYGFMFNGISLIFNDISLIFNGISLILHDAPLHLTFYLTWTRLLWQFHNIRNLIGKNSRFKK